MIQKVKEHKKKLVGGSIIGIIVMCFMSISGCIATYDHKVQGTETLGMHDSHRVELQTDDFILEMRKMDMKELKLLKELQEK